MFFPPKTVSWEQLSGTVATQHDSWEVRFAHRNQLLHDPRGPSRPQKASWELASTHCNKQSPLPALPPMDGKEAENRKTAIHLDRKKKKRIPSHLNLWRRIAGSDRISILFYLFVWSGLSRRWARVLKE